MPRRNAKVRQRNLSRAAQRALGKRPQTAKKRAGRPTVD